jgi:hypothetical protein
MFLSLYWVMIHTLLINLQLYLTKLHYKKYSNPLVDTLSSFFEHCSYHKQSLHLCGASRRAQEVTSKCNLPVTSNLHLGIGILRAGG